MNASAILTALKTALQTSSNLTAVADTDIHLGKVTKISNYPVIVIDPGPSRKMKDTYPYEDWSMQVFLAVAIKVYDESKQLVGDANIKGAADFENDVRKALSEDHTLGGACTNLIILDSIPDDGSDYPVRGFLMTVEILYRQNRSTRT